MTSPADVLAAINLTPGLLEWLDARQGTDVELGVLLAAARTTIAVTGIDLDVPTLAACLHAIVSGRAVTGIVLSTDPGRPN